MPFIIGGAILGSSVIGGMASNRAAHTQANAANQASQVQLDMFNRTQGNLAPWMQSGNMALSALNMGLFGTPGQFGGVNTSPLQAPGNPLQAIFGGQQPGIMTAMGATGGTPDISGSSGITPGMFTHQFNLNDFQASPAYNFNLQQGQMALDKAANARGNLYAPQTLQDLSRFSQGLASNEFQNAFSNYQTGIGNIFNRLYNVSQSGQNAAVNLGGFGTTTGGQIGSNIIGAGNAAAAGQIGMANAINQGVGGLTNAYLYNNILSQNQAPLVSEMVPGQFSLGNPAYG